MGYMHIDNLYKNQTILLFKECWALEKIHGTSAHISWNEGQVGFFSGGASHVSFTSLFDKNRLEHAFREIGHDKVMIFGEAYGGNQQGQSRRYGKSLKFVAFDVKIGDSWLSVPQAHDVVTKLGLEFVHYVKVPTDIDALNRERDAPSEQAKRNGVDGVHPREGVVLRPLIEVTINGGGRVVSKHKRDEERETATPRAVDPAKLEVLTKARDVAVEWVTPTRLEHVLDKLPQGIGVEETKRVIDAMIEDVVREGAGEFVDSREVRSAIGTETARLFKAKFKTKLESK